ncbi:pentatricopeptide repeat-containing protein At1g08070, chloroplastic-like [Selaginella moellendorffii]|uniref:pentatricopeptide repeat-containing protein At1g08070, chloroplastic-like n=1 Tax=Selaginella moellendorffii TaxID=88036 RepID=UPI000D1C81EC|nr:pentatricopeptide repeat-containing protein At1g08070, chloroplastic-like [Selaginella moellendorffii]|eukprot:XP_024543326.1 pentatricopeptide repeat-containing protein At1g08070, chloroplastic-like [Selaginella moellendorffii]
MILAYAVNGEGGLDLELFVGMQSEGFMPNRVTFLATVKACAACTADTTDSLKEIGGKMVKLTCLELHSEAMKCGWMLDHFLANSLIFVYGSLTDSQRVFDKMLTRDVASWSALIQSLVDAYAKCGNIEYGRQAFDRIKGRNLVLWTIMILGYAENGDGESALELFGRMQTRDRILPDAQSYVAVLKACASAPIRNEARKPELLVKGRDMSVNSGLERTATKVTQSERSGLRPVASRVPEQCCSRRFPHSP